MTLDPSAWPRLLSATAIVLAAAAAGWLAHRLLFRILERLIGAAESPAGVHLLRRVRRPAGVLIPILAVHVVLPLVGPLLPAPVAASLRQLLVLGLVGGIAWTVIAASHVVDDLLGARFRLDEPDNLAARRIHTQARVLRRALTVLVVIVAAAIMLMTFPQLRELGASMLASAGLAGLVVGLAARPVLQNLIAGFQIAITQPIRLDDVVIVDGEWGRIEEFTATYVVVRVWDERRLVVPLNHFIENTFQNWTRTGSAILGTVFLFVDYTVPVEEVRQELHRILQASERWDGRAWGLVVTDTTERAMQLRALMSAPDAGTAWELRCEVRERLIAWLRDRYPEGLPRLRAALETSDAAEPPGPAPRPPPPPAPGSSGRSEASPPA